MLTKKLQTPANALFACDKKQTFVPNVSSLCWAGDSLLPLNDQHIFNGDSQVGSVYRKWQHLS
jgi:hypothetical protein